MKTGLAALLASCGLLVATGCGSASQSSGSAGTTTTATSTPTPTATTHTSTSSLKVNGKPKYASPSSSAPVQSGLVSIAYRNIAINPDTVRVRVGSTISWKNYDPVEHNVTSENGPQRFASKTFGENGTFDVKATSPGLMHYLCTIHPASMNGTIEVVR
jgi:plastocyanin